MQIREPEMATSPNGHPEIRLTLENEDGAISDRCPITPASIGRVVSLTDAAGLPRPQGADVEDPHTGRLSQSYVERLAGRWIDAYVMEEPRRDDPATTHSVVQGYARATGSAPSDFPF